MLKAILSLVLLLSVVRVKAQFGSYPPLDVAPVPLKEWVDLIDFTRVPNAPVKKTPGSCGGIDTYCDWSCTNCINATTDYDRCPPGVNNEKIWGISYDDGPSAFTPAILDHLKAIGAKATFFVIGSRITENPAILQRTVAEGHQIAVHTWSHHALTTQTNEEIIGEIKWTEAIIKNVTGVTPYFMRPPFGDIDDRVRGIITQLGYKAVIWDLDTNDWMTDDKPKDFDEQWIVGNFTEWTSNSTILTTSHISLEHDLYPLAAKYAPQALDLVKGAGFTIEQVATCVGKDPYREYHGFDNTTTNVPSTVPSTVVPTATSAVTAVSSSNTPSPSQSSSTPVPYSSNSSSFSSLNIFAIAIVSIIFTSSSFLFLI